MQSRSNNNCSGGWGARGDTRRKASGRAKALVSSVNVFARQPPEQKENISLYRACANKYPNAKYKLANGQVIFL